MTRLRFTAPECVVADRRASSRRRPPRPRPPLAARPAPAALRPPFALRSARVSGARARADNEAKAAAARAHSLPGFRYDALTSEYAERAGPRANWRRGSLLEAGFEQPAPVRSSGRGHESDWPAAVGRALRLGGKGKRK